MQKTLIPYKDTGYFSKLICDYLDQKPELKLFYNRFPSLDNFAFQIKEKAKKFSPESRDILVNRLLFQTKNITLSPLSQQNIHALKNKNTFTITTGHQLNLFTGPLYFFYKILSVVNLCKRLKAEYPEHIFVPVYWMATEDHDFDEINFFNLFSEKIQWKREASGAVGELSTEGLDAVYENFSNLIGDSQHATDLKNLFFKSYLEHKTLTEATRYLVNELFKDTGLVIIDGNDRELKKLFIPVVKNEIEHQLSYNEVTKTTQRLVQAGYHEQVHTREINLFYIEKGLRERILQTENGFAVNHTQLQFSKDELLELVEKYPERFSPNALLRPVYQEAVLPNLAYIGGGGELAYWFQLKDYFAAVALPFPVLVLRNSVLIVPEKTYKKLEKLDVPIIKLFSSPEALSDWYIKKISSVEIDFSKQKEFLKRQFKELYSLAEKTDKSFLGAVAAQEKKQLNGLDKLEKRLLKAQKRNLKDTLERLLILQEQLFPNRSLQERYANFSEFYLEHGAGFLNCLEHHLNPLEMRFTFLRIY